MQKTTLTSASFLLTYGKQSIAYACPIKYTKVQNIVPNTKRSHRVKGIKARFLRLHPRRRFSFGTGPEVGMRGDEDSSQPYYPPQEPVHPGDDWLQVDGEKNCWY